MQSLQCYIKALSKSISLLLEFPTDCQTGPKNTELILITELLSNT